MPEFLLELGTEELPASFVQKTYGDLLSALTEKLKEAGVFLVDGWAMGTPRRQIVVFPDVKERQEDTSKEQRGPALKAAFNDAGEPTPALLGFCRSQGVEVSDLRRDEQYVWATKHMPGRPTSDLLKEIAPAAIRSLTFEKSMRWGSGRMRFARPIRWIAALYDGQSVPFEVEGVQAGNRSFGHRFYSPEAFEVTSGDQLLSELRTRHVEPNPTRRREVIVSGSRAATAGQPQLNESLVDENVYLTEWPQAIQGTFRGEYLELPESVLVTAMAKHEKMFPVRDGSGALTDKFVFIRNSGEDETVRRGSEWVLNARFNDAKFFFDEDKKSTLDDFLKRTSTIVFQEKLGSVRSRADRLSNVAAFIAKSTGADESEVGFAREAALYCKADLATGLVSELASLQGVIGGEYARREGMSNAICDAIAAQYDPSAIRMLDGASRATASRVVMADALDKLAGYLGLGLIPSGSSDPYGLRRAVTNLIEDSWNWDSPQPSYLDFFSAALLEYEKQGVALDSSKALPALAEMFAGRYSSLMTQVRHDILAAAMLAEVPSEVMKPRGVRFRLECLQQLSRDAEFVQTATRPMNIIISARKKFIEYGENEPLEKLPHSALESAEGIELLQQLSDIEAPLSEAEATENVTAAVEVLRTIQEPINRFFESTMVMADQPDVRFARLTLMHACSLALLRAGDFTKLVVEGGA